MNLLFMNFNNYYNRTVKKYNTVVEYASNSKNFFNKNDIDFKPNDGVNTTQVVNLGVGEFSYNPDYLLVTQIVNGSVEIVSRWFIIEWERLRGYQYKASLRRDVIADNFDILREAPMYIEKAVCSPDDIAIYNKEQLELNEIKQNETLLKDKTGMAYVVGYFAPNCPDFNNITVDYGNYNYTKVDDVRDIPIYNYFGNRINYLTKVRYNVRVTLENPNKRLITINENNKVSVSDTINLGKVNVTYSNENTLIKNVKKAVLQNKNTIISEIEDNEEAVNDNYFKNYDEKYYYLTNSYGSYTSGLYKISCRFISNSSNSDEYSSSKLALGLVNSLSNLGEEYTYFENTNPINELKYWVDYETYDISFTKIDEGTRKTKISAGAKTLKDAPYKMFVIPTKNLSEAITIGNAIAKELGTNIYDVQLLPYCPILERWNDNTQTFTRTTQGTDYEFIKDGSDTVIGYLYYADFSRGTLNIDYEIPVALSLMEKKVANQVDKYRLCSPNYSAMFDFNQVRTGEVTSFNVDYTYKPYCPYIHINPNWKELYGNDYDDCRGLICQGDFSLPIVNDQWKQYQINNKNYLNSFNRDVESIELKNKMARIQDITGAIAGTVQGAAMGAQMTGSVAGAAATGALSAGAGVADVLINEKLRNDALDLTKDQFNYSIDNIKALPNTLAKVSSFDYNNKIFPILEYYSCSEQEKTIIENKLIYNGFTINRIDTLQNMMNMADNWWEGRDMYFKAKVIRLEELEDDLHMANTIAEELNKGVYILWEYNLV